MAKNIGYMEPGEILIVENRNEFQFCSFTYPNILENAFSELSIKSKRVKFENVGVSIYLKYLILQCVNIKYE
ncbi:hypothetical protein NUH30_01575 [Leptospira sp. 85282-16]|uniref:Uncharacterized protein n=1 Tax=Leptospira montravelensis TaxID=2484961 RepID=A0ABY2LTN3_9LEPT|nr:MULTISPECIES: hypothetical protein [Leptospira]MCT8332350.1 hypothetical protein [Leptospira sp. 85282-16]TGK83579.1 hypothetical protein EHQ19_03330 [Leptospira montravelensis]TGL05582.1 hypothetical protein EHQ31_02365 [Leptospira montravelensis]